jgi:hypothetical protein
MRSRRKHLDIIPNANLPSLQRRNLHSQTRRLTPLINNPVLPQGRQWLVAISLSSLGVHVGEFTARRAAAHVHVDGGLGRG